MIFIFLITLVSPQVFGLDYRSEARLKPHEYWFHSNGIGKDSIFDQYRSIDLNVNIGVGSDCGRISVHNTLKASLRNLLDARYFGQMGRNIVAASPMLLTCYMSPTWCSILKSLRLKANLLANMRLDQCALIDKYTDSRVEDFYRERQACVHDAIKRSGGNMERAMEKCKNHWQVKLSDWSGDNNGNARTNKLLTSSAKWAGLNDSDSKELVDMVKGFVGDSVVTRGEISVDYGPRRVILTPRTYLQSLRDKKFAKLKKLLDKVENSHSGQSVYQVVSDTDLRKLNGDKSQAIDRQTLQSLLFMPHHLRKAAMRKLSNAIAMPEFSEDMS